MEIILAVVLFFVLFPAAYMLNGCALAHLWQWFMVPLGLPAISVPWAIGISIVVGLLTNHTEPQKEDQTDWLKSLVAVFLRPLLALLIGYTVKLYM